MGFDFGGTLGNIRGRQGDNFEHFTQNRSGRTLHAFGPSRGRAGHHLRHARVSGVARSIRAASSSTSRRRTTAGKGVFTIQVRGGPEAIGMMEQPGAARSGVVDMVYTPCAFYAAAVPECDAVSASTVDGPTARKNGGIALLNQIHQKRAGLVLLGWVDSGIRFNLWSTRAPTLDSTGHIDIKGFKVRGNPIYNAFLTNYLGAQVINLPSTELYTALERGTVDITAWTQIGLMDLNWDRYIKYRILPDFFETDLHDPREPEEVASALAQDARHPADGRDRARDRQREGAAGAVEEGGGRAAASAASATVAQSAEALEALRRRRARGEPAAHEGAHGEGGRHGELREDRPALHAGTVLPKPVRRPVRLSKTYDAILYGMAWLAGILMVGDDGHDRARRRAAQPRLPEFGALLHLHRVLPAR